MLPKSKLNHNESTSLSSLNSVNNIMINYNNSSLANMNNSKLSDEHDSCRALICDSNGIIIAETAYRCMICSQINDSITEMRQHYYDNHSNEFLPGPSTNLANSFNNLNTSNGNFITNSILNNSLNINNGLQIPNFQANSLSNSLLNNETLSAKKRKLVDVVDKIYSSKNVANKNRSNQNLIQASNLNYSTGNSNSISNSHRELISFSNNLNNNLNDDFEEDDLEDQKSDLECDDWMIRNSSLSDFAKSNALIEAINKSSLYMKLNENMNDSTREIKNNRNQNKFNNFLDNSSELDYSNSNIYENIVSANNETDNKEDLLRSIPPGVKLKRGSTTANVGKPGHVSCAVCGVVRYYSCVYRRYGQFTCQVCYRFFRTFFAKPYRYTCTNLGNCPLDVRVRCRACWIQACINLYTVDGQRKQILENYRPLNRSVDDENKNSNNLNTDNNNNSTNVNDKNTKTTSKNQNNESNKSDEEELVNPKNSKKIKKNLNESNCDEELDEESKQDDQTEPLNLMNVKKIETTDDEELKEEDDDS